VPERAHRYENREEDGPVYTIGRLARKFHLSRSTLLYYDSIDLLSPSSHTESGYRMYTEQDAKRLEQICVYRRAGLPLADIHHVLGSPESTLVTTLERRLDELNRDIERLRQQQHFIVGLLKNHDVIAHVTVVDKETWVSLLTASGFSEADMHRWHVEFERLSPEKHVRFLKFLSIPDEEIQIIRSWASSGDHERISDRTSESAY
jgi:MerR family transcriptional regulator, thiopeptide resistance regulator